MKHIKIFEDYKEDAILEDVKEILIDIYDDNIGKKHFNIKLEQVFNKIKLEIGYSFTELSVSIVDTTKHIDSILRSIDYMESKGFKLSTYSYDDGSSIIHKKSKFSTDSNDFKNDIIDIGETCYLAFSFLQNNI